MDLGSSVKLYFEEPFKSKEAVTHIAEGIESKQHKFVDIIESLKDKILSTNVEERVKVCTLLEEVLCIIPSKALLPAEVSSLCEFLCAKLKDHYSLHPAVLRSIHRLSKSKSLSAEYCESILITLFQEVHIQSCFLSVRLTIYEILLNIVDQHKKVVLKMGKDFVYNLIRSVEGEQEPRNLLLVFQLWYQSIAAGIDLGQFVEDTFEIVSCYFPIDFNPPPSDKKVPVTCEDLVNALRQVLSSTPAFAQYCIPLMLEKMESDVQSAKVDAMKTLTDSIKNYYKRDLKEFTRSIWQTLRREVQQAMSSDVETAGLDLLKQLVKNISTWPTVSTDNTNQTLKGFLQDVLDDCLPSIKQQRTDKHAWMACQMLLTCLKASSTSYKLILEAIMPLVVDEAEKNVAEISSNPESLVFLVDRVQTPLNILLDVLTSVKSLKYDVAHLEEFKDRLLSLSLSALNSNISTQVSCAAVACVAACVSANILTEADIREIATIIIKQLADKKCHERIQHELLSVSGFLAQEHMEVVESIIYSTMVDNLEKAEKSGNTDINQILNGLSAICTHQDLLKKVVVVIIEQIKKHVLAKEPSSTLNEYLKCLKYITSKSNYSDQLIDTCVVPLVRLCVAESVNDDPTVNLDITTIKSMSLIVNNCCRKLTSGNIATSFLNLLLNVFLAGNLSALNITESSSLPFSPFSCPNSSLLQQMSVCLLASAISSLDPSIKISRMEELQEKLLDLYSNTDEQAIYVACSKALASLLNKNPSLPACEVLIKQIEQRLGVLNTQAGDSSIKSSKIRSLTLIIWSTKALAMRNHKTTGLFIDRLVKLLADEDTGPIAAGGFDIIMHDSEDVLSPATHVTKKLLYKQRFFLIFMPKITHYFESKNLVTGESQQKHLVSTSIAKANCLTALSNVLAHIPRQVLLQQMKDLIPLLLHSLQSSEVVFLKSVLSTLFSLIQDAPDIMKVYVETLMKDFLSLVDYDKDMKVRIESLRCIGICTILPTDIILPLRNDVIKKMAVALDDRKRLVRSEAAKARSEWFLVGAQ